jgi:hypothetical protein
MAFLASPSDTWAMPVPGGHAWAMPVPGGLCPAKRGRPAVGSMPVPSRCPQQMPVPNQHLSPINSLPAPTQQPCLSPAASPPAASRPRQLVMPVPNSPLHACPQQPVPNSRQPASCLSPITSQSTVSPYPLNSHACPRHLPAPSHACPQQLFSI